MTRNIASCERIFPTTGRFRKGGQAIFLLSSWNSWHGAPLTHTPAGDNEKAACPFLSRKPYRGLAQVEIACAAPELAFSGHRLHMAVPLQSKSRQA